MALITCPECNGQVSDKADVCPHCGYPIREQPHRQTESNAEQAGSVDRQFCIDRIHAGKVYIRCKCGCTIEKPFSFVSRNSQESYTLNETLICPQCHAEALARTDLTNVPSKRIAVPSPRYGNAASGVCPFCGKPNIQAVKKASVSARLPLAVCYLALSVCWAAQSVQTTSSLFASPAAENGVNNKTPARHQPCGVHFFCTIS